MRQEAQDVTNRDEGVFLLSHVYDDLLLSAVTTAKKATVVAETSLILGKVEALRIIQTSSIKALKRDSQC